VQPTVATAAIARVAAKGNDNSGVSTLKKRLAQRYTNFSVKTLKTIYEKANLTVLTQRRALKNANELLALSR
jgi:hypothetical protein